MSLLRKRSTLCLAGFCFLSAVLLALSAYAESPKSVEGTRSEASPSEAAVGAQTATKQDDSSAHVLYGPPIPPSWQGDTKPVEVPLPPSWTADGEVLVPLPPTMARTTEVLQKPSEEVQDAPTSPDSTTGVKNTLSTPATANGVETGSSARAAQQGPPRTKSSRNQERASNKSKGGGETRARDFREHLDLEGAPNGLSTGLQAGSQAVPRTGSQALQANPTTQTKVEGSPSLPFDIPSFPTLVATNTNFSFGALGMALLFWVAASFVARLRRRTLPHGLLNRVLTIVFTLLRLALFLAALHLVTSLVPRALEPAIPWVATALAISAGLTARDVLKDIFSGLFLWFEGRLRPGSFIEGITEKGAFRGIIESVGLRATWLSDSHGYRVAVPNSEILRQVVRSDHALRAEHEVTVFMGHDLSPELVRQALRDAVLASPWVPCSAGPTILRDPKTPGFWHVRSRILEPRYAGPFEGDIVDRAEELLRTYQSHS